MAGSEVVARKESVAWECPLLDAPTKSKYRACVVTADDYSRAVAAFLAAKPPREQAAWLKTTMRASRVLFQPWNLEIVFVVAILGRARFSELQTNLGASSRTLAKKLRSLKDAGFLDRVVVDAQPVRVEYVLTKRGRGAAALASPLLSRLNLDALREAGRGERS